MTENFVINETKPSDTYTMYISMLTSHLVLYTVLEMAEVHSGTLAGDILYFQSIYA